METMNKEQAKAPASSSMSYEAWSGWAVLPLRVFLGFSFLAAGCDKLFDARFLNSNSIGYIGRQLAGFAPSSPLEGLLTGLVIPNATLFGLVVMLGELAIGLGTLAGLFSRTAAFGGFLLSLALWLTTTWQVRPFFLGSDLPYAMGWLALFLAGPHPVLSLDGQLKRLRSKGVGPAPEPGAALPRRRFIGLAGATILAAFLTNLAWLNSVLGKSAPSQPSAALEPGPTPAPTPAPTATATAPVPTATTASLAASPAAAPTSAPATLQPTATTKPTPTQARNTALVNLAALQIGEPKSFTVPGKREKGILVRLAATEVKAYNATCTHEACEVAYDKTENGLVCPCHLSVFDLKTGEPTVGPAFKPLSPYTVEVDAAGNVIFIG